MWGHAWDWHVEWQPENISRVATLLSQDRPNFLLKTMTSIFWSAGQFFFQVDIVKFRLLYGLSESGNIVPNVKIDPISRKLRKK